jgi:hypothetical protein
LVNQAVELPNQVPVGTITLDMNMIIIIESGPGKHSLARLVLYKLNGLSIFLCLNVFSLFAYSATIWPLPSKMYL